MMRKSAIVLLLMAAAAVSHVGAAPRDAFSVKAGAGYFYPAESSLKKIYGNGTGWNAEMNLKLVSILDFWAFGNGYRKSGRLPVTAESTTMRLTTFGGGLKLRAAAGPLRLYAGIGAAACAYREANAIGVAQGTNVGVIGQAGFYLPLVAGLLIDLAGDYASIKVKPAAIAADLGGARVAVRLGYVF
jgi:hypothetical protein